MVKWKINRFAERLDVVLVAGADDEDFSVTPADESCSSAVCGISTMFWAEKSSICLSVTSKALKNGKISFRVLPAV